MAKTFALAKAFQPSVVYVDDADLMFVADKKKAKALRAERGATQALDHAKAALAKEVKALKPTERIVVIGEARTPHACVKKDQKALLEFFRTRLRCPAPAYADRLALWPALLRRVAYDVAKKRARRGQGSGSSSATNTTPRLAALRSAAKATLRSKGRGDPRDAHGGLQSGRDRAIAQSVLTERRVALLTEGKTRHDGGTRSRAASSWTGSRGSRGWTSWRWRRSGSGTRRFRGRTSSSPSRSPSPSRRIRRRRKSRRFEERILETRGAVVFRLWGLPRSLPIEKDRPTRTRALG